MTSPTDLVRELLDHAIGDLSRNDNGDLLRRAADALSIQQEQINELNRSQKDCEDRAVMRAQIDAVNRATSAELSRDEWKQKAANLELACEAAMASRVEWKAKAEKAAHELRRLLNPVNAVTCEWRHRQMTKTADLDRLANRQIEVEEQLESLGFASGKEGGNVKGE